MKRRSPAHWFNSFFFAGELAILFMALATLVDSRLWALAGLNAVIMVISGVMVYVTASREDGS